MPRKRSPRGMAKRFVRRFSYRDRDQAETVNRVDRRQVMDFLSACFESYDVSEVPDLIRGEVLYDSRGSGSFQKLVTEET